MSQHCAKQTGMPPWLYSRGGTNHDHGTVGDSGSAVDG